MPVTSTANFSGLLTPTYTRSRKMPIPGARYRTQTTKSGDKVRLAFRDGEVVEAKNIDTGATHTPREFSAERARRREKASDRTRQAKHRGQMRAARRMSAANG
jgi:hypothetical protein